MDYLNRNCDLTETHLVCTVGPGILPNHGQGCFHGEPSLFSVHLLYILHIEPDTQIKGPEDFEARLQMIKVTLSPRVVEVNMSSRLAKN